jgi:hypothetical protein
LTDNFKPQQHFPDKSIQLIDLVISTARNEGVTHVDAAYVRRIFSTSSGLTEEAMALELQLRAEESVAREARIAELRTSSATEYLRSRNLEAGRLPAAVREAIRLWDETSESERAVYISHEANYQEGTIPTRFLERNLTQLRSVSPTLAVVRPPAPVIAAVPPPSEPVSDSPVLRGADARPVDGVSADVVRAQILQRFPRFLSMTAREAMEDGRPLPTSPDLVNSDFAREVEALTNRVMAEYHTRMDADRAGIDRLWEEQARDHGFVVREGVPDSLLREVAADYIAREAARTSSPLRASAPALRAAAERSLDAREFERHMDLLRHIGR